MTNDYGKFADKNSENDVVYLQSQDGNLYSSTPDVDSEFKGLLTDVPSQLPFCTEGLGIVFSGTV